MGTDFSGLPEEDAIRMVLRPAADGGPSFSRFVSDLERARTATHRGATTGVKDGRGPYGSFLGAMRYVSLLAQIGRCFLPKAVRSAKGNAILRALECFLPGTSFESLGQKERIALAALRRAVGIGTSLIYCNADNPDWQHRFLLLQRGEEVVRLPKVPWDGDPSNSAHDVCTQVNLERVGDMVEEIVAGLRKMADAGELHCALERGKEALLEQFWIEDDSIDTRWRTT